MIATQPLQNVPVAMIRPDPGQPRKTFDEVELGQLAASLKSEGLLEPIVVRPDGEGYLIVAGERRWRAACMNGWETIPAIVRGEMTEAQIRKLQVIENVVRSQLNPVEEARAYKDMLDGGMTAQEIARAVGKDAPTVTWLTHILGALPEVLHLVATRQVTPTVGWHMARLSANAQRRVLKALQTMRADEVVNLCCKIWVEENQGTMFADQAVKQEHARARAQFTKAFDAACRAIHSLWKYEELNPGTLRAALASELPTARQKVAELKKAVARLEGLLDD